MVGDAWDRLVLAVDVDLAPTGFSRRRTTFVRRDGNWGLIALHKHSKNTAGDTEFTIEVGVASSRLLTFDDPDRANKVPSLDDCHWRERIGHLMGSPGDKWWRIEDFTSEVELRDEIVRVIRTVALPQLHARITDDRLIQAWERRDWGGLRRAGLLMRLATLQCLYRHAGVLNTLRELRELVAEDPNPSLASHVEHTLVKLREECGPLVEDA